MGKVNVDDLRTGMVLASDLMDSMGKFLLGQGTVIHKKHIEILKSWGITEADIEGLDQQKVAEETTAQIDRAVLKKCEDYVSLLFQYSNCDHEAIKELKRLKILHLTQKLSSGGNLPEIATLEVDAANISREKEKERLVSAEELIRNVQFISFPDIYYRISKVLNDPSSSVSHLAEVISKDMSLSTKLLRLANSAFYGLPSKVDSVTRAITLIGMDEISTLALGVIAVRFFEGIPQKLIDMKNFWLHSIACGTIASILARNKAKLGSAEERFFVAGLLHDMGKLVVSKAMPQSTKQAIIESRNRLTPLYRMEKEVFGFDHTTVASSLLRKWNFPVVLENMVGFHHEPSGSPSLLGASIIHFANVMSIAFQFGHSGEIFVPPLVDLAWDTIAISPSVLAPTLSQTEVMINEIVKHFFNE
ncbi:MAG TPA: HDOD domain-containing protein [Syntrophales bacterium]|nr:HDOD domain-containing protein [Syntrophales bacterium]